MGNPSQGPSQANFERKEAIRAESLDLGYGDRAILKNLNFTIHAGEIVTILGGSGSGKSTLLKAFIGLLKPMRGNIFLKGQKVTGEDARYTLDQMRRDIGVLFQSGALLGSLTIAENVALPLQEFTDLSPEWIDDIVRFKLRLVSLTDYADYLPSELSGGMIKRAGLARATALDPDILFCDEPSAGLDPITAAEIDQLLMEFNRTLGTTMVVITHELASIQNISHRSIMVDGKSKGIIAIGDPRKLGQESSDPRVRAFFQRQTMENQ